MKRIGRGIAAIALFAVPVVANAQAETGSAEAARTTVDAILPLGTYARIMNESMAQVQDQMMKGIGTLPLKSLLAASGIEQERIARLGDGTLQELMELVDPAHEERMRLTNAVMMDEMTQLMSAMEPSIRAGLVEAYASRFTADELGEMNAFFATPAGAKYARQSMQIFMAPEVMSKMQDFVPRIMEQMPGIMERVGAVTAELPKPRKIEDLSPAERERFRELVGIEAGAAD